ncbi:MAG TPA: MFS transporter [Longimicrobiales bacterium]|nr:MFS transporter [Longimicrobiales bacterium]
MSTATTREALAPPRVPSAARIAAVVAVAHGMNDAYSSFIAPLLPRLMDRLGLSIALAATVAMAYSIASSLLQPLLGYAADRWGRRAFLVAGPLVSGVFVSLLGWAPTFWILIGILTLGGLGSAAFHPPGASYAVRLSEGKGSGLRYSIFSFGGSAGYALGPIIAVAIVQWRGMEGLWIAMIPVIFLTPVFYLSLPSGRSERTAHLPPPPGQVLRQLRGPLGLIFGVSALMAWAQRAFITLEPIIVDANGGSETLGALALTVYLAAQAAGTLTGGILADRLDRRRLLVGLCGLAFPAHLAAVALPAGTLPALTAAAMAGFLGMATLPPIVVMAQEMVPRGAAVGSGIVMGLAWATGSVGVLLTGAVADHVGPQTAVMATMPVILLAMALAAHRGLVTAQVAEG